MADALPNWRGCKSIKMRYYNDWDDPDLIYNGYVFNYWDIEHALSQMFVEETGFSEDDEVAFNHYVQDHAESYLEDVILGGYFDEGSKSWHDNYRKKDSATN